MRGYARRTCGVACFLLHGTALFAVEPLAAATVPLPTLRPAPAATVPLPSPRPAPVAAGPVGIDVPIPPDRPADIALSRIVSNPDFFALRAAIAALRADDFNAARAKRDTLSAPVARTLFDWLYARDDSLIAGYSKISAFAREHPDWPQQHVLRARMEASLYAQRAPAGKVIAAFEATPPTTGTGKTALALALLESGEGEAAAKWARDAWENHTLSASQEARIAASFSAVLSKKNHKARLHRLLYANNSAAAKRTAKRLGAEAQALAKARVAVSRRARNAGKLLDALSAETQKEPIALLSRVQWLRRANKTVAAAMLLADAPSDEKTLVDPWQWWEERRILTRRLLERDNADLAYRVASEHGADGGLALAEAEFLAGWLALRYRDQPKTAITHFERLRNNVSTDLSLSRAHYWLGRSFEALDRIEEARTRYESAARFKTTYYGQLARLKLGRLAVLALPPSPQPTAEQRRRFLERDRVRAARLLGELGETGLATIFLVELASSLDDAMEIALVGEIAHDFEMPHLALRIGKIAASRNLPLPGLAFLTGAVPDFSSHGAAVEPALVHAVARQESAFNALAISPAGARGLMQLMPATAKQTARQIGLAYSPDRLTDDAAYNATVGAAHLGQLIAAFDGSYIMTLIAYNAGPRRVREWIKEFGDPREESVDPIDWIERIPFSETRNYVQRVLENLQVYRAGLNGGSHPIELIADLTRGR